jgi:hypothetical protein
MRFQPLIMRFVWLAERRLVAHNPSLARQALTGATAEIRDATESLKRKGRNFRLQ